MKLSLENSTSNVQEKSELYLIQRKLTNFIIIISETRQFSKAIWNGWFNGTKNMAG